jgi:hypothetical protein
MISFFFVFDVFFSYPIAVETDSEVLDTSILLTVLLSERNGKA